MKRILFFAIVLIAIFAAGCGQADEPAAPADDNGVEENGQVISGPLMGRVDAPLTIDGSSAGYPAPPIEAMGAMVHMAHDGDYLYLHFELAVDGWVSVGFNRTGGGMDGANMILGYLDGASPAYRNDAGRGRNHAEIESPAVDQFYFAVDGGTAIMEFSYPLAFPEGQGFSLEGLTPGEQYTLILAAHSSSQDIDRTHSSRGSANFTVEP